MLIRSAFFAATLLGSSLLAPIQPDVRMPVTQPAATSIAFGPALFPFKIITQDDGKDAAGGWQQTNTRLTFVDGRHLIPQTWTCDVQIGMPMRISSGRKISTSDAARMSADVTTKASITVMHSQASWLGVLYCFALEAEMQRLFKQQYGSLGQRIKVK